MNTPNLVEIYKLLDSRDGGLDPTQYSFKLAGGNFGMDVAVEDDLQIDRDRMSMWWPIADGNDRDGVGDLLDVTGIKTTRHYKNPLGLFDHGKEVSIPIARAREDPKDPASYTFRIDAVNKKAGMEAFFYRGKEDCDPELGCKQYDHALFCEQTFDMADKGFLGAGSIGYQIINAEHLPQNYQTGTPQGLHLKNILMLEGSLVVLPANASTVAKHYSARDYITKCLTGGRICEKNPSPYFVKAFTPYLLKRPEAVVGGYDKKNAQDVRAAEVADEAMARRQIKMDQEQKDLSSNRIDVKALKVPNYRKAEGLERNCSTCQAYQDKGGQYGHCRMFDVSVGPKMICDRYEPKFDMKSLEGEKKEHKENCGCSKGLDGSCSCGKGNKKELSYQKKYITHSGDKWIVHAENGRKLGEHPTEEKAKKQLQAIEINKHKKSLEVSLKALKQKYLKKAEIGTEGVSGVPTPLQQALAPQNPQGQAPPQQPAPPAPMAPQNPPPQQPAPPMGAKSLGASLKDLKAKYKRSKGRFRRLRKSTMGSASLHIGQTDLDRLREDAQSKGVSVKLMGEDDKGLLKVKLSGDDKAMEDLATLHGKVRAKKKRIAGKVETKKAGSMAHKKKSLPNSNQNKKAINPIGTLPKGKSRERASLAPPALGYPGSSEEQGEPLAVPVLTGKGLNPKKGQNMGLQKKVKAADDLTDPSMLKPEDGGGPHGEGDEDMGALLDLDEGDMGGMGGDEGDMGRAGLEEMGLGGEDEGMGEEGADEPYGAQVVRRLHADKVGLLHEYNDFMENVEDPSTRELMQEEMEDLVEKIEKIEEHWSSHERYGALGELEGAGQTEGMEGAGEGAGEGEEEEPELGGGEEEGEEAESGEGEEGMEEPTPDEALEGMREEKALYFKQVKSLRSQYTKDMSKKEKNPKTLGDPKHTPGGCKEKHGGMKTKGLSAAMTKNMKAREQERKYLQMRWKALKTEEEPDEHEKSLIAHRWKKLKKDEEHEKKTLLAKNKSAKKDEEEEEFEGPVGKFLKKFTKSHTHSIFEAGKFLRSLKHLDEYDEQNKHLAFYHSKELDRVVKDVFGDEGAGDESGMKSLRKALFTDVPKVNSPASNTQLHAGKKDPMQQFGEGGSLAKGEGGSLTMGHGSHVSTTKPSSNSQLHPDKKDPMQQFGEGGTLLQGEGKYPALGDTGDYAHPNSSPSNSQLKVGKEPMQQFKGPSLVKHLGQVAEASAFLKSLAYEKAFGFNHREQAGVLAKALGMKDLDEEEEKSLEKEEKEFVGDRDWLKEEEEEKDHKRKYMKEDDLEYQHEHEGKDLEGLDMDEGEKAFEPGEVSEKSLDQLFQSSLDTAQAINHLNETIASLGSRIS